MAEKLLTFGQWDWSGGVDSSRPPTIAGEQNPKGLPADMVSWANNCTFRGGGISPRSGWQPLAQGVPWSGLYQGGVVYEPNGALPYIVMDVGGRTYAVRVDTDNSVQDITPVSGPLPANLPQHWFKQGEQFLVIQDFSSEPRVFDGTSMKKISAMGGAPPYLPTGGAMDYHQGRFWVALANRAYMGGDIVGGISGTAPYFKRDSILHSTENTFLSGGGSFIVPTNAGDVRALAHAANLDTALGESQLYVFTRKTVYSLNVPVTRALWATAAEPLQRVANINFGTVSDRGVVAVNGDLFYQTMEPGIRSLAVATRYFNQWGNTAISNNEQRALRANDRSLLRYASGVLFNNRLLETTLPFNTPVGVAHRGIIPLDFDLISTLQTKEPPAWEGMWEGVQVLQLLTGDFGGLERCFAIVLSDAGKIEVWEITNSELRDNGDNRIQWSKEYPAYTCGSLTQLKRLVSGRMWIDQLRGTCDFTFEYRPDFGACWTLWHEQRECSARDCTEDTTGASCSYPIQPYCAENRSPIVLPLPPVSCDPSNNQPTNLGYQFQVRVTVRGSCRIRGFMMYCEPVTDPLYKNLKS